MRVLGACCSDKGNTRRENQDSIVFLQRKLENHQISLMAVCDGIGGLSCGEIASGMVVQGIREWFGYISEWLTPEIINGDILFSHLKDAAETWNERVLEYRIANSIEMGTTMSLILVVDERYMIIQVGDSRIYSYKEGLLKQLTLDASVTRFRDGKIRKYLDNYMGKDSALWFSESAGRIESSDLLLICSDGLYHNLLPNDLEFDGPGAIKEEMLEKKCLELIQLMMKRGETDNISAGLLYVT